MSRAPRRKRAPSRARLRTPWTPCARSRDSDGSEGMKIRHSAVSLLLAAMTVHCAHAQVRTPRRADVALAARTTRPDTVRGLYVNRWAVIATARMAHLLQLARTTEVNTLVIDVKDDRGYVLYKSNVPLAHNIG